MDGSMENNDAWANPSPPFLPSRKRPSCETESASTHTHSKSSRTALHARPSGVGVCNDITAPQVCPVDQLWTQSSVWGPNEWNGQPHQPILQYPVYPWNPSPGAISSPQTNDSCQVTGRLSSGANGLLPSEPITQPVQPVHPKFTLRSQFSNSALQNIFGPRSAVGPQIQSNTGPSLNQKELDDLLTQIRPDIDIPEHNRGLAPSGLKNSLYRHQEVALNWMKQMEEGANKGGILADDMGLGKTVSTLALMLADPAKSRPKTNLIIGPLSLLRQWQEEIKTKAKETHKLSVFLYHTTKATIEHLLKYDVVITTYGTLAQEFKRHEKFIKCHQNNHINEKEYAKFPLLHPTKATFHRIILDEAHCIKNQDTKTAKACHSLKSTYRWCLTGTPMMNGILELYSLLKFLRIEPYNVWETFRQTFGLLFGQKGDPKNGAMNKLRALLKAIMLRRKKDSELDGKPILQLPEKKEHIVYAKLSSDERDFYKQLEEKAQIAFSKYLREGSVGKNYSNIMVWLVRLRQACCHPHLIMDVEDAVNPVTSVDVEKIVKELDGRTVDRIKGTDAFECPTCFDAVQSPSFFVPCGHDSCKDCLARIVDNAISNNLHEGRGGDGSKCPVCRSDFKPNKCFTYEIFNRIHMPETVEKMDPTNYESGDGEEESDGDENDDDGEEEEVHRKGKEKKPDVKPSMLKSLRLEAAKNCEAYERYMGYLRKTWMPAAKVSECMKLLKEIQETGEKTIVFSQWTLLLDLLQVAMRRNKFPNEPLRYDGSMSGDQRSNAATQFKDEPQNKVMLVSLRAGNAGLNLTAATRVIIMDPFWNPYIEMQAIDRTYRIGQQKEVEVYRILTLGTVEDRIVSIQNKKKDFIEAALNERESMKIDRLDSSELEFLFSAL